RLIEDENFRMRSDGLGDFDDLLLRHAKRGDAGIGVDLGAGARQGLAGGAVAGFPIDTAPQAAGFDAEGDVFGDGEIGKERGLLINGRDAEGVGLRWVVMLDYAAGD